MSSDPGDIVKAAQEAMELAYSPYSGFAVGAAVRGGSGRIYSGCNIENAAYPEGWCAETSAISALIMAGESKIIEVAVAGGGDEPCTPCGGCRQRLREFAHSDTPLHVCSPEGVRMTTTLGELLPHSFGPENLE
ncbi:MAG: cytidine deaminase [Rhodospirillales bacterium]|nr:cytidine deaminase [Alphaproteobacteria bacterium]MBL6928122.1 cytidine deaminase [Rhodospirillales bacterium]